MFFKKLLTAARGGHTWLSGRWIQETPQDRSRYTDPGGYTPDRVDALMRAASTGDTSDLILWGGIVLLGLAGLVIVMKQYHSRKQKK